MPSQNAHDIDVALNDAVQAQPDLGAVTRLDDAAWLIEALGKEPLLVEWAPAPPRLVLTAPLGQPAPGHELLACQTALTYNAQWQHNGGVRVARDPDEGDLLLMTELQAAALADEPLTDALARFGAVRALWVLALQGMAQEPMPPEAALAPLAERA